MTTLALRTRLIGSLGAVLFFLVTGAPAIAQSGMHRVADPGGRYTISFPTSWEVMSMKATPLAGDIVSELGDKGNLFSMMMAVDPHATSAAGPAMLLVMGIPMDKALSPRTFGMATGETMKEHGDGFAVVSEGTATIAKRPAFYRYFTMLDRRGNSVYAVMVYFTVGKLGYIIVGATENDAQTVRRSFGDISRILETFHPTGR